MLFTAFLLVVQPFIVLLVNYNYEEEALVIKIAIDSRDGVANCPIAIPPNCFFPVLSFFAAPDGMNWTNQEVGFDPGFTNDLASLHKVDGTISCLLRSFPITAVLDLTKLKKEEKLQAERQEDREKFEAFEEANRKRFEALEAARQDDKRHIEELFQNLAAKLFPEEPQPQQINQEPILPTKAPSRETKGLDSGCSGSLTPTEKILF